MILFAFAFFKVTVTEMFQTQIIKKEINQIYVHGLAWDLSNIEYLNSNLPGSWC